jgi:hypothetical protein
LLFELRQDHRKEDPGGVERLANAGRNMSHSVSREYAWWIASTAFCFLAVFWSFWPMLNVPPFEHHSLLLFEHGAQNGLFDFFAVGHAAGLRSLPYYSFVLHVKSTGFAMLPVQIINIASISLAMLAVAAYARYLFGRIEIVLFVPLLFFSSFIWWQTVEWTPSRQDTMVLIFACIALACFHARPRIGWLGQVGIALLLLCAGLSKETGMVAMVYIAIIAAVDRDRRTYIVPAVVSFAIIIVLRQIHLTHPYSDPGVIKCEDMSFLFELREKCVSINLLDIDNLLQVSWNAFLGTFLALVPQIFDRFVPLVFDDTIGFLQPQAFGGTYVAYALCCLTLMAIALKSNLRATLSALLLVVLNAAVLVSFWRLRNMGVGLVGGLAILSFGLLILCDTIASWLAYPRRWQAGLASGFKILLAALLLLLNVPQAERFRSLSAHTAEMRISGRPGLACGEASKVLHRPTRYDPDYVIDRSIVEAILRAHGVDPEQCNFSG